MTGSSLSIDIEIDDRQIQAALRRLAAAGADLKPAFAEIGEYLDLATRERFDREQAPDGTPWEPLSDATLRRRMLKGVKRGKGQKRRRLTTRAGNTRAGAIKRLAHPHHLHHQRRHLLRRRAPGPAPGRRLHPLGLPPQRQRGESSPSAPRLERPHAATGPCLLADPLPA